MVFYPRPSPILPRSWWEVCKKPHSGTILSTLPLFDLNSTNGTSSSVRTYSCSNLCNSLALVSGADNISEIVFPQPCNIAITTGIPCKSPYRMIPSDVAFFCVGEGGSSYCSEGLLESGKRGQHLFSFVNKCSK